MKSRQAIYRKRWRINPARLLMNLFLLLSLILFFHYFTRNLTVENREPENETVINITTDKGDTLWGIARTLYPDCDPRPVVAKIREMNGLQDNPTVFPGQLLKIPAPARANTGREKTASASTFLKPVL